MEFFPSKLRRDINFHTMYFKLKFRLSFFTRKALSNSIHVSYVNTLLEKHREKEKRRTSKPLKKNQWSTKSSIEVLRLGVSQTERQRTWIFYSSRFLKQQDSRKTRQWAVKRDAQANIERQVTLITLTRWPFFERIQIYPSIYCKSLWLRGWSSEPGSRHERLLIHIIGRVVHEIWNLN
jgi:hypothetical protein